MATPSGEECRYETRRWVERKRSQRTERHRSCRERPWWDPQRWFCEIVNVVRDFIDEIVHVVREMVCTAIEAVEEIVPVIESVAKAGWGALDNLFGLFSGNDTGQLPIIDSQARPVPSRPNQRASARSLALGLDSGPPLMPYNQDGAFVALTLVEGVAGIEGAPSPLAPATGDLPAFAIDRVPANWQGPLAVSYDGSRLGDWGKPPQFDLIAAAGDRAFAKASGDDALYLLLFANPYRHRIGRRTLDLPQSFFKLDPECGSPAASRADLLAHVAVPGDDERHPATERFPLFRFMFRNLSLDIMDVHAAPLVWIKIDARPRRDTPDPPRRYPRYGHVTYRSNFPPPFRRVVRQSVRYERVLDLGIGSTHLHEQHDNRFGGEADALSGRGGFTGELLVPARRALFGDEAFEAAYRFANGPIEDYGGWVDGTCIYFQLVQLKSDQAIGRGEWAEAYAVLWIDEQMSFTERWRVLHPFDRDFTSPFQPILGIITRSEREFYPDAPFSGDRFFCPLLEGHIRPDSRMAVARQHVALTGVDPESGEAEIYTIHFSWPTMDKTWRRRFLPGGYTESKDEQRVGIEASGLRLREDQMLLVPGRRRYGRRMIEGLFFQPVLPASGQEAPSVAELGVQAAFTAPIRRYTHPWRFVGQDAGAFADATYSHFGVHESVDGRDQLYQVRLHKGGDLGRIERALWLDEGNGLRIRHKRLNYAQLVRTLEGLDGQASRMGRALVGLLTGRGSARRLARSARAFANAVASARESRTHPSIYNTPMKVRLGERGTLGWIMTLADRRDDKLIGLDALPGGSTVRLVDAADPYHIVEIELLSHRRNARDLHGLVVGREVDALSPPAIEIARLRPEFDAFGRVGRVAISLGLARGPDDASAYDRYDEWIASNVWRVRLAAIVGAQTVRLFDLKVADGFQRSGSVLEATWDVPAALNMPVPLEELLGEAGQASHFVSLWGVGPSGLAAIPDQLVIAR